MKKLYVVYAYDNKYVEVPKYISPSYLSIKTLKMCNIEDVLKVYKSNISSLDTIYCFFDEIQYSDNFLLYANPTRHPEFSPSAAAYFSLALESVL